MKKFLLTGLLAIAAGVFSFAQPKVGDVYEVDGIKTIVIHVSDDGKSGIVTSGIYIDGIDYLRSAAWTYKIAGIDIDKKEWNANKKAAEQKRKEVLKMFEKRYKMHDLFSKFNEDGEHNFNLVSTFCEENGLSMEEYFPEYAMVRGMGEGWYIPGYQEAEYYVNMLGYSLGEDHSFKLSPKEMANESTAQQSQGHGIISMPSLFFSSFKVSCVSWNKNHKKYDPFCMLGIWKKGNASNKYWYNVGTVRQGVFDEAYNYYHSYLMPVRKVMFSK